MQQPVPPGACAILVREDFLDVPLGSLQFWLDSVYVAIPAPGTSESSVLVLHAAGDMWITNSVFQGAGNNSRAIGVSTKDGGGPSLFVSDTIIAGFTRIESPGIVAWHDASVALDAVTFRNNSVLADATGGQVQSGAVTAYPGAGLLLLDVLFEGTLIDGQAAGVQAVAVAKGPPPAAAFAWPPMSVWRWPNGPSATAQSMIDMSAFPRGFIEAGAVLSGIRQEQQALMQEALGVEPPHVAPAAVPAAAPSAAPGTAPARVGPVSAAQGRTTASDPDGGGPPPGSRSAAAAVALPPTGEMPPPVSPRRWPPRQYGTQPPQAVPPTAPILDVAVVTAVPWEDAGTSMPGGPPDADAGPSERGTSSCGGGQVVDPQLVVGCVIGTALVVSHRW
eukprot:jgi/Ulvmu1/10420/UM062_0016.1